MYPADKKSKSGKLRLLYEVSLEGTARQGIALLMVHACLGGREPPVGLIVAAAACAGLP